MPEQKTEQILRMEIISLVLQTTEYDAVDTVLGVIESANEIYQYVTTGKVPE